MRPISIYPRRSNFAVSEPPRWETEDGIEVVDGGADRKLPHLRFVAQRVTGGDCAWGPTREAAAQAVRNAVAS